MNTALPFDLQDFEQFCQGLKRVGIEPGYVMYTNCHASDGRPAARLVVSAEQLAAAQDYLQAPSDQAFVQLVKLGVLFDTEWDRNTRHWSLIAFEGWEVLHRAFAHLHGKTGQALEELTGLSDLLY